MTTFRNFQLKWRLDFSKQDPERLAGYAFICWILFLFAFDLLTVRCFPVPWIDEVMFADPAATLVLQGHWASTAWYGRGDLTYWTGNVPAYSFLQVPWLWLFGVNAPAVRSLNCLLVALTMICIWFSVKRLNLIPSPKIRFAALVSLSLCYPISYCVRCGRPDVTGMLIFSAGAFFWSCQQKTIGRMGLFFCAVLIPFSGLQYAFYMPVLLGVLFWVGGKQASCRLFTVICGGILGAGLLWAYHQFFAGWDGLLKSIADVHSRRPPGFLANLQVLMDTLIFRYYFGRPHYLLLIGAVMLLGTAWKQLTQVSRQNFLLGWFMLLIPGIIIGYGSHFAVPYHWLAIMPAMILLASAASKSWENLNRKTKLGCVILTVGLAISGRIMFVAMGGYLENSAYTSQIEKTAMALVQPGEIVYGDWQLYYALKPRAGRIYFPYIIPQLTRQERESISTAFLPSKNEDNTAWLSDTFGGHWSHEADFPIPQATPHLISGFSPGYFLGTQLSAYRRDLDLPKTTTQSHQQ